MNDILNRFRLDEKVAIVTGAGSGLGRAIAICYAQVGANVVVADLNGAAGEKVAHEIAKIGKKSLPFTVDVTDSDELSKLVETAVREFGSLDILVNNVGGAPPLSPMVGIQDADWERFLKLNLTSVFLTSKAASRVMIDQNRGNIINISSASGTRAVPGLSSYAAAKAGVINFTKTLSVELCRYRIRVNCIIPGAIETELGGALRGSPQDRVERAGIPLGRIGQPEDVAFAAIYLASDASDYVTGTCIEVTGGPNTRKGDMEMFAGRFPKL